MMTRKSSAPVEKIMLIVGLPNGEKCHQRVMMILSRMRGAIRMTVGLFSGPSIFICLGTNS